MAYKKLIEFFKDFKNLISKIVEEAEKSNTPFRIRIIVLIGKFVKKWWLLISILIFILYITYNIASEVASKIAEHIINREKFESTETINVLVIEFDCPHKDSSRVKAKIFFDKLMNQLIGKSEEFSVNRKVRNHFGLDFDFKRYGKRLKPKDYIKIGKKLGADLVISGRYSYSYSDTGIVEKVKNLQTTLIDENIKAVFDTLRPFEEGYLFQSGNEFQIVKQVADPLTYILNVSKAYGILQKMIQENNYDYEILKYLNNTFIKLAKLIDDNSLLHFHQGNIAYYSAYNNESNDSAKISLYRDAVQSFHRSIENISNTTVECPLNQRHCKSFLNLILSYQKLSAIDRQSSKLISDTLENVFYSIPDSCQSLILLEQMINYFRLRVRYFYEMNPHELSNNEFYALCDTFYNAIETYEKKSLLNEKNTESENKRFQNDKKTLKKYKDRY